MESVSSSPVERIAFGPFCLTPSERLLTRNGAAVEIGGRSLDLLMALLEQPGRVLLKHELLKRVWPDVIVEESSLRFHMASLRKVLRDGEDGARYIATQVGVGYAFVAAIERLRLKPPESTWAVPQPSGPPRPEGPSSPSEPSESHAKAAAAIHSANLPSRPLRVIGRAREISSLTNRIADTALFTIVGPAGVGKTTLAIEIAHASVERFANNISFVDLGTLQDPALIPSAIAGALGIQVQADDLMSVVLGHIRTQQVLLILDNCEHLVAAVASIVERIRNAAPRTHILATSREALRVRDEHVHWLEPLEYPRQSAGLSREELLAYPAVELFVERASAGNSALAIDAESARTIAEMCRRLDGMALPIELTAGRVATHGLGATSKLLGERLSLAWTGRRTAAPRQQTLQATLDWSYDLLSDIERRAFERLALFLGAFSFDAALHVVADEEIGEEAAVAALDGLTAKSLVAPDRSTDGGSYRLLEMTREYAKKALLARGIDEYNAAARRHAVYFIQVLEKIHLADRKLEEDAAPFSQMLGNIRSALDWSFGPDGDLALAVPLAAVSTRIFLALSLLVECRAWCERASLHLAEFAGTVTELEIQSSLGLTLMFTRGNSEAADVALRRALDLATSLDDPWSQLRLLGRLHIFHERIGDLETARRWAERALRVADGIGEPEAIGVAASLAGISHHLAGDQKRARRDLELSLRHSLPSARGRTICYGFDHRNRSGIALARTLWLQGYPDQARRAAERTVQQASELEHPITHCIALIWSLSVDVWMGDLRRAEASLDAFATAAEVNAFGPYVAASGGYRGLLNIESGNPDGAVEAVDHSLERLHAARYELLTSTFEIATAQGLILSGRPEEAIERVSAAIDHCRSNGDLFALPELLRIKASAVRLAAQGGTPAAEQVLLESLACSREQGAKGWELRTAIDLARLWIDCGRGAEAALLLRPLCDSFSEGLETRDLRDAGQVLKALPA